MAESEEEQKSLLMKMKQQSERANWKLNIQKAKITASGTSFIKPISKDKKRWFFCQMHRHQHKKSRNTHK